MAEWSGFTSEDTVEYEERIAAAAESMRQYIEANPQHSFALAGYSQYELTAQGWIGFKAYPSDFAYDAGVSSGIEKP